MKIVGDGRRERRAEHRDRRGEDEPRPIAAAGRADGFEQRTRAVEIDPHALVEIELGLAGHHAGQMKDHLGPAGDGGTHGRRIGDIGRGGLDFAGEFVGLLRGDDIDQRELVDGSAVERAVSDEPRYELAPDHARGAGDENMHRLSVPLSCPRLVAGIHVLFAATLKTWMAGTSPATTAMR